MFEGFDFAFECVLLASPDGDGGLIGEEEGLVFEDSAGLVAFDFDVVNEHVVRVQLECGRRAGNSVGLIAEAAYDEDPVVVSSAPGEGGGVEVGGWEVSSRIAVDLGLLSKALDDDVVVDKEVRIVVVFVLAGDEDDGVVRQQCSTHAVPAEVPLWMVPLFPVAAPCLQVVGDAGVPNRIVRSFGVDAAAGGFGQPLELGVC